MENKITKTIISNNMINSGDTLIIGVSGGADSMCLLHFLLSNSHNYNINIIVAHINHSLRGAESDRDESFVKNYCSQNSLVFKSLKVDINILCKKNNIGTEECGRQIRYNFFENLAKEYNAKIVTAHTASDNAETMIFNITRGTGLNGMCGIKPVRGNIIRPLIGITRTEVEDYCKKNSVAFITDSTNFHCDYTRNVIRHKVIPVLKSVNNCFEQNAFRLSRSLEQDNSYLNTVTHNFIDDNTTDKGILINVLFKQHPAILSRIIIALAESYNCYCLEQKHIIIIEKIIKQGSGSVNLPQNLVAIASQGYFRIIENIKKEDVKILLNPPQEINVFNKKYILKVLTKEEYEKNCKFNKMLFNNALNYDIITVNTFFRNRENGDVFKKSGRGITKTLKKLFNESKIPQEKRSQLAVIANDKFVLWTETFGVSEKAAVLKDTKNVLCIEIL